MPDRLKDIYNTLEEIQAGGGLGGGGTTDVSALAKELTLASVVTNTGATTVAVQTLETNVITASGVQTLSLNSATSAQTTTLGTAIGATNTALGVVNTNLGTLNTTTIPATTTAVNTVKSSVDALKVVTEAIAINTEYTSFYLANPVTVTQSSVMGSVTSVILANLNQDRRSLTIFNNSNAHLFICTSATATQATAICRLDPYGYYEMPKPISIDIISGIWDAAHGNASIYEGV